MKTHCKNSFSSFPNGLATYWVIVAIAVLPLIAVQAQAQTYTVLHTFTGLDGSNPRGGVVVNGAGVLYGSATLGGRMPVCDPPNGCGTLFRVDQNGVFTKIHAFAISADAQLPGTLIPDGTDAIVSTAQGSAPNMGAIFELAPGTGYRILFNFTGADGAVPFAPLIHDGAGNLYGTTTAGGQFGFGTIFKLDSNNTLTTLYSFSGGSDGNLPVGVLARDADGNLYGTSLYGGDFACNPVSGCGVAFKLDTAGTFTVLHTFHGGKDGYDAYGGLISDTRGNFYGTTTEGGAGSCGTIYKITSAGQYGILHSLAGSDGCLPNAPLIRDNAGEMYGSATSGGNGNSGTVFKVDPLGNLAVLYTFTGGSDGKWPYAPLFRDNVGSLYGTTANGGDTSCAEGCGLVFKVTF